jgi:hypothetical protein
VDDCFVVRDDTSSCGLRRLHLLKSKGPIDRDEVLDQWVWPSVSGKPDPDLRPGDDADASFTMPRVEAALEYQDEAGIWHLRLYWREGVKDDQ